MDNPRPVLVVDDEYYVTRAISYLLQEDGFKCISRNDPEGIAELAEREHPLVIILDINMPKTDGFTICKELRSNQSLNDSVIIILTARGQEEDIERGLKLGANEYILKPFNPVELRDKVKAIYNQRAA